MRVKRVLVPALAVFLFSVRPVSGQVDTLWTCRIVSGAGPAIYAATEAMDGGFVAAGTDDPASDTRKVFITRTDAAGAVLWQRSYGAPETASQANAVVRTVNGNFVAVGTQGNNYVLLMGITANGDSLWSRTYFGVGQTKGNDAAILRNGNISVIGYRLGSDGQRSDVWLLMCTSTGDTLWTRMYGGNETDVGSRVAERPDGGLAIGAHTRSYGQGNYDLWLLLTDAWGYTQTTPTFGTTGTEICYGLDARDNHIFIAGRTEASGDNRGYLAKADGTGSPVWNYPFSDGMAEEQIRGVITQFDGSALCAGWIGPDDSAVEPWLLKIDTTGAMANSWRMPWLPGGRLYGIVPCHHGGYLLFGTLVEGASRRGILLRLPQAQGIAGIVRSRGTGTPLSGIRVTIIEAGRSALTDAAGRFALDLPGGNYTLTTYGACVSPDTLFNVTVATDSVTNIALAMGSPSLQTNQTSINVVVRNHEPDTALFTLRNAGNGAMDFSLTVEEVWPRSGWLSAEPAAGIVPEYDSLHVSIIVRADTTDDGAYDFYGWLHIRARSCPDSVRRIPILATVLDANEPASAMPRQFTFAPPFPNPFNPSTTLAFTLPRDARAKLAIWDITGRQIAVPIDHDLPAGRHQITLDATRWAAGVYFARLTAADFTATQKLLLVK